MGSRLSPPPLLYLDVDGPLIPFGGPAGSHPEHLSGRRIREVLGAEAGGHPLLARLDPRCGARIAALPCRAVWATTWEHEANVCVAPLLGLPRLPVLEEPDDAEAPYRPGARPPGVHWKTPLLVEHAGGAAFAWVDDEIGAADREWVAAHHPGPALLLRVDPRRGLTEGDFEVLEEWLPAPW
ncbi:hypothetical protein HUT16_30825 [Kitasatospora sp. NA04385]|uniref:HAD domain-containing protein n=1 Tax=Kitasatospora sp. NA04385 TaxID=2742135 RepID=UPI00159094CD|nr:HAD domain-containing protein [Kitasatospora sp. NA04385]QKW22899.1 hypothetical protein HUT16_30825 [Kitasatospora sp. NA04385]